VRPAAAIAAALLLAIEEPVFLTVGGSYAAAGPTTLRSFVSTGREAFGFTTCVGAVAGGRFVGWLEVGLATLSRPCADADPEKTTAANKAHTERQTILLEKFKLKTPIILVPGRGTRDLGSGQLRIMHY